MEDIINKINKDDIISYSKILSSLSPFELVSLGSIFSLILVEALSPYEQNTVGNFLEMVGQVLLTSFAQSTAIDPNINSPSQCEFNRLKAKVESLQNSFSKLDRNQH